jgi:hypothetical protein
MRVIVTGSRDWPEQSPSVARLLSPWPQLHMALGGALLIAMAAGEPLTVVQGGAEGIDSYAQDWVAIRNEPGVTSETHPPDWGQYGKMAGPIRNAYMASLGADLCFAFLYEPEGKVSKGTRNMIREAELCGIPVFRFDRKED